MSHTLDYSIKGCFHVLSEGCRWNVLSVLMLHANVRNRCWVTMDTITRMACNGNRKKAVKAKQWLIDAGAIEMVDYNQRMSHEKPEQDETKLSPRRHVYQLTGHLKVADEQGNVTMYNYLYTPPAEKASAQEKETPAAHNSSTTELFQSRNSSTTERSNMKRSKLTPLSISNKESVSSKQVSVASDDAPAAVSISDPAKQQWFDYPRMKKAVQDAFKVRGAQEGYILNMLRGTAAKDKRGEDTEWSKHNLEIPATPEEVELFGKWYAKHYPGLTPVRVPEKIESEFLLFRDEKTKYEASLQRVNTAEQMREERKDIRIPTAEEREAIRRELAAEFAKTEGVA